MKRLSTLVLSIGLATMSYAQLPSALDIAPNMYPGWNLGNTLEAGDGNTFTTDADGNLRFETYWQDTKTTQEIIDFVKQQGFRSVRIPCAWMMGHVDNATSVNINAKWMARVREIVDFCVNDGLYVVLNDHWDGGWLENNLAAYSEETARQLRSMWTQIAEEFRDYDEHLLFAGFNEPDCNENNNPKQGRINALLMYEQDFVDAVRATGGNNASRTLVVQAPSTSIDHACQYLKMPTDVISDRLMVEVHYYSPPQFTGIWENNQPFYFWGADNHVTSGSYKAYNSTWGEESYLQDQCQMMYNHFASKGYPVILGEYGANWRDLGNNAAQKKHDSSIKLFHKLINQYGPNCGMIPFVWDINVAAQGGKNGIMTVINRSNCTVFCDVAMEGITEGAAAAKWPQISAIEQINADTTSSNEMIYDLMGRNISYCGLNLFIVNGQKRIIR